MVIEQRKFTFCPTLAEYPIPCLIIKCTCKRFYAACCFHTSFDGEEERSCHHYQLAFTDGACPNNGRASAKAGLGITVGDGEEYCWSIPVDDNVDPDAPRTNQRAELLAAIEGLKKLEELYQIQELSRKKPTQRQSGKPRSVFIVVTDSEYVVKGITEWLPMWRGRGWRTSDGRRPTNLDLFLALDEYATSLEQDRVEVGFWHVPRAYNHKADGLARLAA